MFLKVLVVFLFSRCVLTEEQQQLMLGGIFYEDANDAKEALLLSAELYNFRVSIKEVSNRGETLKISNHICDLAAEGVIGIIDGLGGRASEHIQAVCDMLEIPHVVVQHSDFCSPDWSMLSLYPSPIAYNTLLQEYIVHKEWTNFTLLYVKGHSMIRSNRLLMMRNVTNEVTVSVRELSGDDYRDVLINAKHNGYTNFVVDCPSIYLERVLNHVQQVALMADEHSYVFLSPDLFTLDLTRYRYGGVNMTGLRLVNLKNNPPLWEFTSHYNNATGESVAPEQIKTKLVLIHDAVQVFYEAYKKLPLITAAPLSCDSYESWMYGSSLLNFMRTNRIEGLSGTLIFDGNGQRSDVNFEVLELTPAGNQTVAEWKGYNLFKKRPSVPTAEIVEESIMRNKTFKVLISLTAPYAYEKISTQTLEGNDRYEGFTVDLIEKLAEMLGFSYDFEVQNNYGSYDEDTDSWDGMVKQLMDETADFAICDFTITAKRQSAIDFSTPFMTTGIGILYKEPSKQPPEMFSFMAVFSKEVWYNMLLIQLGLGVVMIFVGRISHKEWQNPVPCIEQPEELTNQFSFANSIWLIIGSVMQQGSEIAPIALAPRMITSIWWFFTMVMVASYVGALVAVLTVENNVFPFQNVKELYEHKSIAYGAKDKGSTIQFFQESTSDPMYKNMYQKMKANKWLVEDNKDGVERAEKSSYAMFMEGTAIEYYKERKCDLVQVGGLLVSKSYGIGMKKDSSYKTNIDDALLKLKERGDILHLKDVWWKEKRGGGQCLEKHDEEQKQLGMKNMIGAFVVLGVGCLIGLFISILDMLWGVFKRTVKYNTTFKYELVEELKFALKFSGDIKPVKRPQKASDSAEALAETEGKDEIHSLRSLRSGRSTDTHRTCHSHSSKHSGLSVAFARRRQYT